MNKERVTIVDLAVLKEFNLSANELFALIDIYHDDDSKLNNAEVDYQKLENEKFIKIIKDDNGKVHIILRQKGNNLIDTLLTSGRNILTKKSKRDQVNIDIVTRLPEFREKWKGLKPGSMGSLKSCRDKLTRWMNENPEYTFDDVLKAAEAYIDSLGGDYRFLQRADYFIYKQENNREESSRLSAFIDEIDMSGTSQGDWTTQLN